MEAYNNLTLKQKTIAKKIVAFMVRRTGFNAQKMSDKATELYHELGADVYKKVIFALIQDRSFEHDCVSVERLAGGMGGDNNSRAKRFRKMKTKLTRTEVMPTVLKEMSKVMTPAEVLNVVVISNKPVEAPPAPEMEDSNSGLSSDDEDDEPELDLDSEGESPNQIIRVKRERLRVHDPVFEAGLEDDLEDLNEAPSKKAKTLFDKMRDAENRLELRRKKHHGAVYEDLNFIDLLSDDDDI